MEALIGISWTPRAAALLCALSATAGFAQAQCDSFVLTPSYHATGTYPTSVAIGDVDGDLIPDMAVSDATDQTLSILIGTGNGAFAPALHYPAGSVPRAVALGDLDGDLDLDAVVCNLGYNDATGWHGFGFSVLWNTGGQFSTSTFVALPATQIQPSDIALGDLDGDLDLDVVLPLKGTGSLNSKVASFLNDGTGQFGAAAIASTGYDPVALALGDFDLDGALDATTANYLGGSFSVLHGNGNGTFGVGFSQSTGAYSRDIALGDIDGDNDPDIALTYRYGVHIIRNTAGVMSWVATLSEGLLPMGAQFADLDGDGDTDLVAADQFTDTLLVWRGNGAAAFVYDSAPAVVGQPVALTAGDLDGDGDPELAVTLLTGAGVAVMHSECPLSTYCTAKLNSLGCLPAIGSTGTPSLGGADDFHVTAINELNQTSGIVFFGLGSAALPFAGGTLCVRKPHVRTAVQSSGGNPVLGDCSGVYDFHVAHAWLGLQGWGAGQDLFAQYWSRDPADADHVALSNGLRFTLQP